MPKVPGRRESGRRKSASNFLTTTMKMIDDYHPSKTLRWSPDGLSFLIEDIDKFYKVLPEYYKTRNYSSFVRQLNMYNFHKIKNENGLHEFKHPSFRRGGYHLLKHIQRKVAEVVETLPEPESKPAQMIEPVNDLLKELEERKKEYDENMQKLMIVVYMMSNDPETIPAITEFFNKCNATTVGGNDSEAFLEFISKARESFLRNGTQSEANRFFLSCLGPESFRNLFPTWPLPETKPRTVSNGPPSFGPISARRGDAREPSVQGREDSQLDRSFQFRESMSQMSPYRANVNIQTFIGDMSESQSVRGGQLYRTQRNDLDSLLQTPMNERK